MTVYAGLKTTPSQVIEIDTPGMVEAGRWIGEAGDIEVSAFGNYGDYNHVAPDVTPSKIIPLRELKLIQRQTLSAGEGEVRASTYIESYIDNYLYLAPDTDVRLAYPPGHTPDPGGPAYLHRYGQPHLNGHPLFLPGRESDVTGEYDASTGHLLQDLP